MSNKWLLLLLTPTLAACSLLSKQPAATTELAPVTEAEGVRATEFPGPSSTRELLRFQQEARLLGAADLSRRLNELNRAPSTPQRDLCMAMLLGQMRGTPALTRAIAMLDGILKSDALGSNSKTEDEATAEIRALAQLLHTNFSEWKRLDEALDRQARLLKESQQRSELLRQQLEALKDIEQQRSSPVRKDIGDKPP